MSGWGCVWAIAAWTSNGVAPANGGRRATSSYSVTPSANRSLRASARFPAATSGAMYAGVPSRRPSVVWNEIVVAFSGASVGRTRASPKSTILTVPSGVTRTLSGFKSRWIVPAACAAASPPAIWIAVAIARSSGSASFSISALRSSPGTCSMLMNSVCAACGIASAPSRSGGSSGASPNSKHAAMAVCCSATPRRASSSKRRR